MQKHVDDAEAQKLGCWQLATTATKQRGFKRGGLARDCAVVVLAAMRTFALDAEMQARGCLVLGWCFYKHPGVAREMDRQGAADAIKTACANFSANVAVNSNAQWAMANLHSQNSDADDAAAEPGPAEKARKAAIAATERSWGVKV